MKKVLVMLSSYNGSTYIKEQIDSILEQKSVEVFLLIRDDGSTDNTKEVLKPYISRSNIKVCFESNIGCTNSFLKLLYKAKEKYPDFNYYAFSDQDDYWLDDKLSRAIECLDRKSQWEGLKLYCSNLTVTDHQLNPIGLMWTDNVALTLENSIVESHCTGCTMVFNKEVLDFVYDNQPTKIKLHDKWIFHSCLLFGHVFYDDDPHILYRQHGNNVEGAGFGWKTKLSNAFKSLCNISRQHTKEEEAQELLHIYKGGLSLEQLEIINTVANYKTSIQNRIKLLYGYKGIRMNNSFDNFKMKIRIILGSL